MIMRVGQETSSLAGESIVPSVRLEPVSQYSGAVTINRLCTRQVR